MTFRSLPQLHDAVIQCRRCPRLVEYRERVACEKVARFREQEYWGKPVPPFGDPQARLLILGLAPAAHGGNRTGRTFTGDRSGDWLFRALHQFGFATQPTATARDDGLALTDAYITNIIRCAPPSNRPAPAEKRACQDFLIQELQLLEGIRVVVALGRFAFDAYLQTRKASGRPVLSPRPAFAHGSLCRLDSTTALIASYHPSRQNTQTGKLTEAMFHAIFQQARGILDDRA